MFHEIEVKLLDISTLLLLVVTHFPPSSEQVTSVALSPSFISAVGTYISHLDSSIRRCGMLVAEVVASRAGKNLAFGDWEGDEDGKTWARNLRQLCSQRDVDFEPLEPARDVIAEEIITTGVRQELVPAPTAQVGSVTRGSAEYDSDDSLTGYASPTSSRSASPTPSELEEIEKDPTLHVGVKKVPRPVYLAQLGELVRSNSGLRTSEDDQQADKIEMALNVGEELIRRKRDYGTELAENVVNLVYGFVSLNNNFDLDDFDNKRQRIVVALVACCPRVAAQCVIEEFFKNQYSTEQRFVMLNALALGARELASLPVYSLALQPLPTARTAFPSKTLPPALHKRYLATDSQQHLRLLLDDITQAAIDRGHEATADKVPEIVRERQLRIRKPAKVAEAVSGASRGLVPSQHHPGSPGVTTFTEVAAEFFIMPFINRFWAFLRDEQTREERTAQRDILYQYRGAGTGLVLNPVVLAHFVNTLSILAHASQNALQWLALIAPDALELAVTIGSRQITKPDSSPGSEKGKEASVLTSALDLSLIILDGCLELDGGRSLGLEHTALLVGVGEWAGQVFGLLDKGVRVEGGGGIHEVKLRRAAAGVILKVDELTSKWRRSMVDVR
ncbi:telomere length regulation protein-domain-containing protein [Melanogaster broomeanus]|nr:telomere length regulation protein-domain-containing protein [Melanogaster broomeanus]